MWLLKCFQNYIWLSHLFNYWLVGIVGWLLFGGGGPVCVQKIAQGVREGA